MAARLTALGTSGLPPKLRWTVPRFTRGLQQTGAPEGSKTSSRQCQPRHRQQFRRKRNLLTAGFWVWLPAAEGSRARRNAIPVMHLRYR